MFLLLYYTTILGCFLHLSESLECYQCSNVTSTKDCTSKVTCPQGQKCYTSTRAIGPSETLDLGCKSENDCFAIGGPSFVGRSADTHECSQCCQVDNCNGNLCSDPIQVDGGWSHWVPWSHCDVTCGSGHMTRTRTCTDPAPAHGGLDCVGEVNETTSCSLDTCPVHGGWSLWSPWGYCSVTCEIGLERRDRSCSNPYPSRGGESCYGDSRDYQPCFVKACADGLWSPWSNWGSCSATCLGGLQKRTRSCDNPAPTTFGRDGLGDSADYQQCNNRECPHGLPVSFKTSNVSNTDGSSDRTLIYTNTEINVGDGYDHTTGIFTAPETGIYMVVVQTCVYYRNNCHVRIMKDGHVETSARFLDNTYNMCYSTSAVVSIVTGNKVWVEAAAGCSLYQYSGEMNVFQGTKIGV